MDPSIETQYHALLSLAEGFRTNDPPDMSSTIQCLIAVLQILPPTSKFIAKTNLQIGRIILQSCCSDVNTGSITPCPSSPSSDIALQHARNYLEKSLQSTRDHHGDGEIEEVKFEAASLLSLVYERQNQTQGSINLLRKCLEHSTNHPGFHCRLLFQLAQTYARIKDFSSSAAVLSSGADYSINDQYTRILFLLSKGMMLMISSSAVPDQGIASSTTWHSIMTEMRSVLHNAWTCIDTSTNIPPMQKEGLTVFFLLLQVCHFINTGQVKSMKAPLKSLQLSIQTITQQESSSSQSNDQNNSRFMWLSKDHMCILVYLVTVIHSMQAGYMDKAQKYTEKALMQIESLRNTHGQQQQLVPDADMSDENDRMLTSFQLILLEHMAMCRMVMGQRGQAIKETVQALQICRMQPAMMEVRHKPVIQTLLGLYAMSMNQMTEAEKQLSTVLRCSMISSDLRIMCSLNLCIVYLRMNRESELNDLLNQMAPEKLPSQSHSLKAASFYVMGLNAFFKQRFPDAKRFLRETLKIANSEDLNRLTSCSLVLLGHIFYSLGSHRESMNMVTPAMQLASKIPDIQIQLWATALLKDLYRDEGNQMKVQEYANSHSHFQQQLYQDQCHAVTLPEHEYISME